MDNQIRYQKERTKRWAMAKDKEPEAIKVICDILTRVTCKRITYLRYDEIWFEKYDPENKDNEWVLGASDYAIQIDNSRYIYAEIKIKSKKYNKTVTGGLTKKGSKITKYGCKSFYLDIIPVYRNMCSFVEKTHIDRDTFLLFFINEELNEVHAISLREIQTLVETGYLNQPICVFSEGYGTKTEQGVAQNYLIPEDSTHDISKVEGDFVDLHSADHLIIELEKHVYVYNGYYHRDRLCKYIKNKQDSEVQLIICEAEANDTGYKICNGCCVK